MDPGNYVADKGKRKEFRVSTALAVLGLLIVTATALYLFVPALRTCGPLAAGKKSAAAQSVKYLCPMHPFVAGDHPGACSICGMTLVAQEQAAQAKAVECSVHVPGGVTLTPQQRVMANVAVVNPSLTPGRPFCPFSR